ncbi:UBP-type zinc finger domain-containing protein [Actinoplanes sp. RD1]|uniref:UBP-type zinc finger domain-containing protein n=1 Tax=Actinoplanes sp. RD1 TaxID=3064538 RepID=UPI002740F426|nr:UBP-type zinc finger domain-containing protein [Actinoplanes sp. RD1]
MTPWTVVADAEGEATEKSCAHLGEIRDVRPSVEHGCEDCLREGTRWVHLRECLSCGHVGCCDNSPRRHATAHWRHTGHAIVASREPGEDWAWCYADDLFLLPEDQA